MYMHTRVYTMYMCVFSCLLVIFCHSAIKNLILLQQLKDKSLLIARTTIKTNTNSSVIRIGIHNLKMRSFYGISDLENLFIDKCICVCTCLCVCMSIWK